MSALCAYFAVRDAHLDDVWNALGASNYWWLVPAFAALALANLLRACRWQFLFAPSTRPPFRSVLRAMLIGLFFNNVLPARAGEAARVVALKQSVGTSRAEAVGTVVIERAYDVLSVLMILFVTLAWLPPVTWLRAAVVLAVCLSVGIATILIALIFFGQRPLRFLLRPLGRLPFLGAERMEQAAENLVQGLAGLRRPGLAAAALAWTTASWLAFGLSAWFVMLGFDLGLSPMASMLVIIAVALAMILPSSPAAIGVFEAATLVALKAYDVPSSQGLSYALVLHALNFIPYIVAGLVVLHLHTLSLRTRTQAS